MKTGIDRLLRRGIGMARAWKRYALFASDFTKHSHSLADGRFLCRWADRWPCLWDASATTPFDAHYVYHPAWAMRMLRRIRPVQHVDVASSLSFVTMASAFVPLTFVDLRPVRLSLSSLVCREGDVTRLPFPTGSVRSLSCMHVVEHVGLGRYGDALDPRGDLKAMGELERVLAPEGDLLFVVPVGAVARIQYNAHRIYTYDMITGAFACCDLREFALIDDDGRFRDRARREEVAAQRYGCGCFWFTKR